MCVYACGVCNAHAALWVLIVLGPCCCSCQFAQTLVNEIWAFPALLFCASICCLALRHVSDGKFDLRGRCSLYSCPLVVAQGYNGRIEAVKGVACVARMLGQVLDAGQYPGQLHVWCSCAFCSCQLWLLAALLARVGPF